MKVVIEKTEASIIQFDPNNNYPVLKNFINYEMLGFAKISLENGIMYAELNLRDNVKGYPAIGYVTVNESQISYLEAVAICDSPNEDESIELIEYIK